MDIIEVMKKYINNEMISDASYDSDLLTISIEQSLQPLLYNVTGVLEYKKYYISWVIKQESFYNLQNEITDIFNENNIKHIYFKGAVLSKIYDDPSVRTRGDIDIYIDNTVFDLAKEKLLENGYELESTKEDSLHHITVKKNGIEVELHFNMFDSDVESTWRTLFTNPFELTLLDSGSLYRFTDTYHFIYCLMHFAQHLRHGAGIRYMLDFYYMFIKTSIDFTLLHETLKQVKLEVLYSNIINVLRVIFERNFDSSIQEKEAQSLIDYMLSYGIHGHSNNGSEMVSTIHSHKFKYAITKIFLTNKNYRLSKYPKLGRHWYLYPICLIKHFVFLITHKLKAFFKFLFAKNKNKDIYKKMGI
ncbi:MAG: nucleotidyltransferase family protein [Roseburia sp.]|nr:nucleotidyltransferase family protein [Anaeroplasma bactoclasticum]MCM1196280.1 nucleotidyltransferase family protein [Roseburia sp.]MCM1557387.1 nucleotidyltransferase family protein [Anaeroplasma bactoclasticum]